MSCAVAGCEIGGGRRRSGTGALSSRLLAERGLARSSGDDLYWRRERLEMAFLRRNRRENNEEAVEVEEDVEVEDEIRVEAEDERRVDEVLPVVEGLQEEAIESLTVRRVPIFGRVEGVLLAADASSNGSSSQYRSIIDETSSR